MAYTYSAAGVEGLLKHQKALVLITAGGLRVYFQGTNSVELIYRSMTEGTLQYCGIQNVQHQVYFTMFRHSVRLTGNKFCRILSKFKILHAKLSSIR